MGRGLVTRRMTRAVSTPGRLLFATLVSLLVVVLAFAGISQTLAVWNSEATAVGSATGAKLKLATNFGSAGADFANHRTSVTGSFTLTNETLTNSSTPGVYSASIAATGAPALRAALAVTIWPRTAEGCTAAATPQNVIASGSWASAPFTVSGDLVSQETDTFCMRMSATDRAQLASPGGTLIINPSINATLSIGNWNATATGAAVQSTAYIFPQHNPTAQVWYQLMNTNGATTRCASVTSAGALSAVNCGTSTNQQVKFVATGDNYHEVVPRSEQSRRLDVFGASTAAAASVDTQVLNANRPSQDWQVQYKGDVAGKATFQVVNRNSGYCMQLSGTAYIQQACNGSVAQTFTLEVQGVDVALAVTCAKAGNNITYQWNGAAAGQYIFAFQNGTTGPFVAASPSVTPGESSITFTPAQIGSLLAPGANNFKVTWLGFDIFTGGSAWKEGSGAAATLACQAPSLETLNCLQAPPNSVVIGWGHNVPAGSQYTIQLLDGTGGAGAPLLTVTSGSGATLTADNWADGLRTIRITSSSGPVIEIQIAKTGGTSFNSVERLWCVSNVVATVCSPQQPANRANTVTLSWPSNSASGTRVMMSISGEDEEKHYNVTTAQGTSRISIPASDLWNVGSTRFTLYNGTTGYDLGERTFDTTRSGIIFVSYASRCS